jgi:hypothetical protein
MKEFLFMKHQKRVFYLTHSERPALVRGFLSLLTLAIPIVSLCLLPVTSFAGNTSGGQMVNSGIIAGYPCSGHAKSGGVL